MLVIIDQLITHTHTPACLQHRVSQVSPSHGPVTLHNFRRWPEALGTVSMAAVHRGGRRTAEAPSPSEEELNAVVGLFSTAASGICSDCFCLCSVTLVLLVSLAHVSGTFLHADATNGASATERGRTNLDLASKYPECHRGVVKMN